MDAKDYILSVLSDLARKYNIEVQVCFYNDIRDVSNPDNLIIAVTNSAIIFNESLINKIWNKNEELAKRILLAVCYHEFYHYLRYNGYVVFNDFKIKAFYPKLIHKYLLRLPFIGRLARSHEEILAIRFEEKHTHVNHSDICKLIRELGGD